MSAPKLKRSAISRLVSRHGHVPRRLNDPRHVPAQQGHSEILDRSAGGRLPFHRCRLLWRHKLVGQHFTEVEPSDGCCFLALGHDGVTNTGEFVSLILYSM